MPVTPKTWRDRTDEELGPDLAALRKTRTDVYAKASTTISKAKAEGREMTEDEVREFDAAMNEVDVLDARLDNSVMPRKSDPVPPGWKPGDRRGNSSPFAAGEYRSFGKDESLVEHLVETGEIRQQTLHPLAVGKTIRGIVTGDWTGAENERRALSGLSDTAGGYMLGTELSAFVIDKARAKSVTTQAGVRIVPMTTAQLSMARVTSDPTPAWRNEGGLLATSEPAFGAANLRAKSLGCLIPVSKELLADAANAAEVIQATLFAALALEFDRAVLDGDGVIKPRGIRQTPNVGTLSVAGAATTLKFAEAIGQVRQQNEEPNAIVLHPRTFSAAIDRASDSTGQPLALPPSLRNMPMLQTTSVPANLSGTNTVCYVGDWSQVIVGLRQGIQIAIATQGSDSNGRGFGRNEVLIAATLRADSFLVRENAFVVMTGVSN